MKEITIGTFADMTGSTVKTVLYYHRVGLIPEPERSSAGYRLYDAEDLARMRAIRRLKDQGLDIRRIKAILGESGEEKTTHDALQALRAQLLEEREALDMRIGKIDGLLREDTVLPGDERSVSFEMIAQVLGPESMGEYESRIPDLFDQTRRVMDMVDGYRWGEDHRDDMRDIADYFREHPQDYHVALTLGQKLAQLAELDPDDPAVDVFAHEAADFAVGKPELQELLTRQSGLAGARADIYDEVMDGLIPPAQRRFGRLFKRYLTEGEGYGRDIREDSDRRGGW